MVRTGFTTEQLCTRWEAQREIKNLMGKYSLSLLLEKKNEVFEDFWSADREDVCLGLNNGWYVGRKSVQAYFNALYERTALETKLMVENFPDRLKMLPEKKLFGVGHFDNRPVSSPIIAVADDGQTAKGMWTCAASVTDFTVSGPESDWVWGFYAVDFVLENGNWKIWHMRFMEEIHAYCGSTWTKERPQNPPREGFSALADFHLPEPDVKAELYKPYANDRSEILLPRLPEAYATFSDTFTYGIEEVR